MKLSNIRKTLNTDVGVLGRRAVRRIKVAVNKNSAPRIERKKVLVTNARNKMLDAKTAANNASMTKKFYKREATATKAAEYRNSKARARIRANEIKANREKLNKAPIVNRSQSKILSNGIGRMQKINQNNTYKRRIAR